MLKCFIVVVICLVSVVTDLLSLSRGFSGNSLSTPSGVEVRSAYTLPLQTPTSGVFTFVVVVVVVLTSFHNSNANCVHRALSFRRFLLGTARSCCKCRLFRTWQIRNFTSEHRQNHRNIWSIFCIFLNT